MNKELIQIGNIDTAGHNSLWGRVYDPDGIAANLNANGGGMGAKTGLYAVKQIGTRTDSNDGSQPFQQDRVYDPDGISPALQSQLPEGSHKIMERNDNGTTEKRNAIKALYKLREAVGEKTFFGWAVRIVDSFQQKAVLQSNLHEGSIQKEAEENKPEMDDGALPRSEYMPERELFCLWEEKCNRCSSQGRELAEQFAGELNQALSQLSQQNSQTKTEVPNLWETTEGTWLLQQTLSTLQKIWKSENISRTRIRRLTPKEAERLQGYKDGWTATGINEKGIEVPVSDSQRYKCCGNSVTTFVVASVMEKLYGGM